MNRPDVASASVTVRRGIPIPCPSVPGSLEVPGAALDLYAPSSTPGGAPPIILWVHGGGYVMGSAAMVADLATGLAAAGYAVAGLEYTLAPAAVYPTPVHQAGAALIHLREHARELGVDPDRVVLAGDSAGAQIASQLAAIETNPSLARATGIARVLEPGALRAAVLCCGMFDMSTVQDTGFRGLDAMMNAYLGVPDWTAAPVLDQLSTTRHVTPAFPPTFLAVGDADPFVPQTLELAQVLRGADVPVETDLAGGGVGHEYQLNLRVPQARATLARIVAFLDARTTVLQRGRQRPV